MELDFKILKIGALATSAIIAPVATILIREEYWNDDDYYEFEGDGIELIATEAETTAPLPSPQAPEVVAPEPAPVEKSTPKIVKQKQSRKGRKFRNLDDCLRAFLRCTTLKGEKRDFKRSTHVWGRKNKF